MNDPVGLHLVVGHEPGSHKVMDLNEVTEGHRPSVKTVEKFPRC